MSGNPEMFFVMNGDVCGEFPLHEMLGFHKSRDNFDTCTIMGTEVQFSRFILKLIYLFQLIM